MKSACVSERMTNYFNVSWAVLSPPGEGTIEPVIVYVHMLYYLSIYAIDGLTVVYHFSTSVQALILSTGDHLTLFTWTNSNINNMIAL